jgi:hypothetical protein
MIMNRAYIFGILYIGWSGLGFFRGIKYYKYKLSKKYRHPQYLYINQLMYGLLGTATYALPTLLPFTLYKEAYRLEVYLRNLEGDLPADFDNILL